MKPRQKQNSPRKRIDNFIRYSSLGVEMMSIMGILTFLGHKIDQWMGNGFRGFTLGLMILSVIVAIVHGIWNLLKNDKRL